MAHHIEAVASCALPFTMSGAVQRAVHLVMGHQLWNMLGIELAATAYAGNEPTL
mgnify:CR=1 FL=1